VTLAFVGSNSSHFCLSAVNSNSGVDSPGGTNKPFYYTNVAAANVPASVPYLVAGTTNVACT